MIAKTVRTGLINEFTDKDVVPYNPALLRILGCHVNVEYVGSIQSIKYVTKYCNKGVDRSVVGMENEIEKYILCRYISTSFAIWRLLEFPIHEHRPPVEALDVHLPNGERVYFNPEDPPPNLAEVSNRHTKLTEFFKLCQEDEFAQSLLYCEVPKYYRYNEFVQNILCCFKIPISIPGGLQEKMVAGKDERLESLWKDMKISRWRQLLAVSTLCLLNRRKHSC